ncbi:ABC transporter ATP-binding protein [Candidatus Acetothermia bacterium]|jgi:peptide/nickel transport system ATP-binding protein|nr:ABC transporter ATP-binding protein [Candidatus Acetothermia bacterium]
MQNEILLTVENLHTWFELRKWGFLHAGFVRAVDGVNFELGKGEAVAVVGESGCGKSTLARTIMGLIAPTQGKINFNGRSFGSKGLKEEAMRAYRSQVGYIQQDPYGALASFMNVRTIMEEPLRINGVKNKAERRERIEAALTEVKMTPVEEFLPKFPHMLSGGQQQRVVIARAMIMKPSLILADEPVSMLDASVRVEILQLLETLRHSHNLGLIYITHDLATVRYFTERIFVMYGANLVEMAVVQELLDNPLHPYTRALLTATSDPDPENAHIFREVPTGEPPSLRNPPAGCRFHPRCSSIIKGLCDVERPPDFYPQPDHSVMCWLYK